MNQWPWDRLNHFCSDPTQRSWVENELRQYPIPPGQSPEDWLLVRSMVAEGQTEADAWAQVWGQSAGSSNYAHDFLAHPDHQPLQSNPQQGSYDLSNAVFQQPNGFYQDHQTYEPQPQQQHHHIPYGFVSLQDIAPQPRQPSLFSGPSQSQSAFLQAASQFNGQLPVAGPSKYNPSISPSPQPPAIDPGRLVTAPTAVQRDPVPILRVDSPFKLEPPNSARSSTSTQLGSTPLSVLAAPGKKRAISPLRPAKTGASASANNRQRASSSSIDPPPPPSNGTQTPGNGDRKNAPSSVVAPAPTPVPVTWATLQPLLAPNELRNAKPVALFKNLRERVVKGVDAPPLFVPKPKEVREIALKLKDYAPAEYLKAMADDDRYAEVWENWLLQAKKAPETWEMAIAPIFQVLTRTDMPIDYIKYLKLRTHSKELTEIAVSRNLASKGAIEAAYLKYKAYLNDVLFPAGRKSAEALNRERKEAADNIAKGKRKAEEDGRSDPTKVPAVSKTDPGTSNRPVVKTTSSSGNGAANGSGSSKTPAKNVADMSFFKSGPSSSSTSSAAKPKTKLPDIKKLDRASASSIVQSSSSAPRGLLSSVLQTLAGSNGGPSNAPASSSNNPLSASRGTPEVEKKEAVPRYNKKGKLIGEVRFRDTNLEEVRLFKEEAWEFELPFWKVNEEGQDEDPHGLSAHQLDQAEGAALASAWGHHTIPWHEPTPFVESQPDVPPITPEVEAQNERERGILAISYPPGIPIPDPTEEDVRMVEAQDSSTRIMDPMNDSDQIVQHQIRGVATHSAPPLAAPVAPVQVSVSDLLSNLRGLPQVAPIVQPSPQNHYPQQPQQQPYGQDQNAYGAQAGWGANVSGTGSGYGDQRAPWSGNNNYARTAYEERSSRGHADRNNVCSFWLKNECRNGDRCRRRHAYPE